MTDNGENMNSWNRQFKLKPVSAEEQQEVETVQGMRKRLRLYARYHPMVRNISVMSEMTGLSGEDEMTIIAFNALLRLEELEDRILENAPLPIYIAKASNGLADNK